MTQGTRVRRDLLPEIPADIDDSRVTKARGVVTLPRWVNWSEADPTYDLDDRRQRALLYEQVLSEGTADDVRHFVAIDTLIEIWDELVLPRAVSVAWIEWIREHRGVTLSDWRDRRSSTHARSQRIVALSPLQQRVAALVAGLAESQGFALAGGSGLAAHDLLDRPTRDVSAWTIVVSASSGPPWASGRWRSNDCAIRN